ncbi:GATA transcription factor 23-like [Corylus avellana]|uniref:GATA transcription factor 23-like n=1 Tax=Corylus avellana TaxID=13451 RepID=UPI00286CCAC9|nr:GATA transcription factor 23-like [Corylus avellana]
MMDLVEKESLCVGMMSENKKCCSDCKTTKTPLWRGGPAGPKSLCNACGIRYRKRRVSMVGFSHVSCRKRDRSHGNASTAATTSSTPKPDGDGDGDRDLSECLKTKLMALGKDLLLQRSPSVMVTKKQRCQRRRKLKEEEQAAVCLMALSCDSVFA